MTDHTPTLVDRTFTCPACAWRAVVTTDGRIVQTQAGEFGHDHIGQAIAQLAAIRGEAARQIQRSIWLYQESCPIPGLNDDIEWRPSPPLTMRQVRAYSRYIKAEHGL